MHCVIFLHFVESGKGQIGLPFATIFNLQDEDKGDSESSM